MITYHPDMIQGSDEWHAIRCGMLTASAVRTILTPTLKIASNDKERSHLYELMAQRISRYVEPAWVGADMLRGQEDEIEARALYAKHYAPVQEVGFITNDKLGFMVGFSPDGLVGDDGFIEVKSRRQKFQVETIAAGVMPDDYLLQVQTGFFVTERKWCDFISYSGGLPMFTLRVYPDPKVQDAIVVAATAFEKRLAEKMEMYRGTLASGARLLPTERRILQEMYVT